MTPAGRHRLRLRSRCRQARGRRTREVYLGSASRAAYVAGCVPLVLLGSRAIVRNCSAYGGGSCRTGAIRASFRRGRRASDGSRVRWRCRSPTPFGGGFSHLPHLDASAVTGSTGRARLRFGCPAMPDLSWERHNHFECSAYAPRIHGTISIGCVSLNRHTAWIRRVPKQAYIHGQRPKWARVDLRLEWAPVVGQFQAADLTGLRDCFSSKRLGLM